MSPSCPLLNSNPSIFFFFSCNFSAASVAFVQQAIEHIYPLVYEFRKKRSAEEERTVRANRAKRLAGGPGGVIGAAEAAEIGEDEDDEAAADFNVDDLIEVDEDFVEEEEAAVDPFGDDDEDDIGHPTASTSHLLNAKRKRRLYPKYRGRKRPAGKSANDPVDDIMQVSDDFGSSDEEDL